MKIKILEKLPDLETPEAEETEKFRQVDLSTSALKCMRQTFWVRRFPNAEKISPPLLQLNDVTFGYTPDKIIIRKANIDVGLDSRIAVVGPNGAGKSTL
jgi:ATP-binding cassette subfamily F protein 3